MVPPDKRSFREEHRIRGYEVSPDQRATIVTVANLLQEVAGNHAVGMWGRTDEGFASLPSMKDLLFVMTRLQVRMYEYPKWGDVVAVETYFTEEGRLAFRREWKLMDVATGKLLGAGTSTWVTINTATRRLSKLPEDVRKRFLRFAPPSSVHILPPEETKKKLQDMELPGQVQSAQQVARRADMDMNGHINNVTYLAWTLESLPERVMSGGYKMQEIELDFKAECTAGNAIEAHCNPLDDHSASFVGPAPANGNGNGHAAEPAADSAPLYFLSMLQKCDENGCTELVRARTTWSRTLEGAKPAPPPLSELSAAQGTGENLYFQGSGGGGSDYKDDDDKGTGRSRLEHHHHHH
uniref:Acyl-[acyl-carrier-protein] hydrolase n=1 Tax=Chlamydomonas reinhardtii TaxID=3055 RepID=UPI003F7784EC